MSASPELRRSPVTLDQLFPRPRPPPPSASPTPNSNSPIRRQLHLHLLPLHTDTTPTTLAAELPSPGPSAPPDQQHQPPATEDDEFRTPTDEPHRIPTAAGASCGCPPAPRKPRPSAPSAPACRRRLIQGELLRIAPEEVERLFGRTWTRNNAMTTTTTPDAGVVTRTPAPEAGAGPDLGTGPGPAVLPAKKRKRCYAQVAGEKEY